MFDKLGLLVDYFGQVNSGPDIMKAVLTSRGSTRKQRAPGNATVRVGPLSELPALLRDLGCDPDPIFAAAGFETKQFMDPDTKILYLQGSILLAGSVAATGCDHLGLMLGQRASPSSLGVAGFILQACPNVGDALRGLVRHLELHDQGGVVNMVSKAESTSLAYAIQLSGVAAAEQIYDMSMAIVCKIMRSLCGENWDPTVVLLPRRLPGNSKPYHKFFRAPIRFDAGQSAVEFPSRWLTHRIPKADPLLHRHLEKEAETLHASQQKLSLIHI